MRKSIEFDSQPTKLYGKAGALVFSVLLAATLTACTSSGVAGSYQADDGRTTLVLKSDNSFEMDTAKKQHVTGTWKVDGEKITMTGNAEGGFEMTVRGTIKNGDIHLQFGPQEYVYTKK